MTDLTFDETIIPMPTVRQREHVLVLHQDRRDMIMTADEGEQYAADILRACAAARAFVPPKRLNRFNRRARG